MCLKGWCTQVTNCAAYGRIQIKGELILLCSSIFFCYTNINMYGEFLDPNVFLLKMYKPPYQINGR